MIVKVIAEKLNVRENPTKESNIINILNKDVECEVSSKRNGFGKLANHKGWIMLKHTEEVKDEDDK